ncbi:MAG: hypothetical protein CM15mP62_15630 [Rhodospirillaceae bacterium]|nr:MAG: hypothetical protein CM15mP62_15630 [Rhodospirillaceae bacterium]
MVKMTYAEAAKLALAEEMRRDPLVWAIGEDLGRGGVFGQYLGLLDEFGPERISDAPISESAIMGASVERLWLEHDPLLKCALPILLSVPLTS